MIHIIKHYAAVVAVLCLIIPAGASAEKAEIYTPFIGNDAVGGYDTVAYFTDDKAVEGKDEFTTEYKGANWKFVSQKNLDLFLADPTKYAPQYGGYCAYAVANGATAKGDPEEWYIHEGKLYLNLNDAIQQRWLKNKVDFITKADANWPSVLK